MSKKPVVEAPVVEAPVVEAPVQTVQVPKGIGKRTKELIHEGLGTKEIVEQILKEFPGAKTSPACVAWYKNDIKKKNEVNDKPFQDWKKANGFDEASLKAKFMAEQV